MSLDKGKLMAALDWAYDKAIFGAAGLDSAEDLARPYMTADKSPQDQCKSLIRWQVAKAGASGFVTGLGGLLTLPVAIPANLASVMFVQLRMIAAIAVIGGHDPRSDKVRTLAYLCLCGTAATDIAKGVGIKIGVKLGEKAIERISRETIVKINQRVGFRLLTKFGEKGAINLGKLVPFIGGLVGGGIDAAGTKAIGAIARKMFVESESEPDNMDNDV